MNLVVYIFFNYSFIALLSVTFCFHFTVLRMMTGFNSQPVTPGDRTSATCRADFLKRIPHIRWRREDHHGDGQYMDNCNGIHDCGIDDCKRDDIAQVNIDGTVNMSSTLTLCASTMASALTYKCILEGDDGQILQKTSMIKLISEYHHPKQQPTHSFTCCVSNVDNCLKIHVIFVVDSFYVMMMQRINDVCAHFPMI